jgi:hypothetical protein
MEEKLCDSEDTEFKTAIQPFFDYDIKIKHIYQDFNNPKLNKIFEFDKDYCKHNIIKIDQYPPHHIS